MPYLKPVGELEQCSRSILLRVSIEFGR